MPIILSGVGGPEAEGAAVDRRRRRDDQLRAVRAGGRLRRRRDEDPRPAATATTGCSTAPRAGSPTPASPSGTRSWRSPTRRRAPTASPRSSCTATTRASPSAPRNARWASRARPPASSTSPTAPIPADRIIGAPGTGFKTALRTLDFTRPTIGAQAVGIAQGALDAAVAYVKERKQFGTSIGSVPGRAVHARRHGDEDRGRPAPGLRRRRGRRAGPPRRHPGLARRPRPSPPTSRCR